MTKPIINTPPEADPAHPGHHAWLAGVVNGLLETGVFVLSGGRVHVGAAATVVPAKE